MGSGALTRALQTFEEEEDPATKSFFSEIISSISDIKFSADGRYIISRDYMTIKLWDMVTCAPARACLCVHAGCFCVCGSVWCVAIVVFVY